ncbi:MAG: endonuclease/exonuclease/phosphatase family protein [Janthinobacterium lividum]
MRRSFAFKVTLLALAWLVLAIACERVPAGTWWPAVFGALTVPGALLLAAALALYWLRCNWRVALLPAAALALCWPHVQRGLALHWAGAAADFNQDTATNQGPSPTFLPGGEVPGALRLLSANVRIFNVYAGLRDPDFTSSKAFITWLAASPADVLCLQEFYNEPRGSRENGQVFRSAERLGAGSGRHAFVSTSLTNRIGAAFGLAIFSRFPIVRRGVVPFGKLSQNHAMWADLARPGGPGRPRADTVRVFNLHLQSMSLAEGDIVAASTTQAGLRDKAPNLLRRFRNGAVARAWQTDTVLARVRRSPYPVLLAGDFNDLPYSYTYDQFAGALTNAWAAAGLGLGATYHGRLPGLRIDQQFASAQWRVLGCRVHREILWSDHFPVEALYRLGPK